MRLLRPEQAVHAAEMFRPMPGALTTPRAALLRLARLVASDLSRGRVSPGLQTVGSALSESPDAVLLLLDLLLAETRKKRPSERLCDALLLMLGQALAEARMALEADAQGPAAALVADVRRNLVAAAEAGRTSPELLMALARQFALAKLDFGEDLRALTATGAEQAAARGGPVQAEDIAAHYAAMAAASDQDPFLIHEQLSEQVAAFPGEQRAVIVGSFITSDVPAIRAAALGWLLDPDPAVRRQVAQDLAASAARGLVSAACADRMVLMRPWLPEAVQASLDAAVRTCRQRGEPAVAKPAVQINAVIASGCDGAGAQSFFVLLKRGRKLALAALLVKHGFGVRDAWVREDLGRREVDQLLTEVGQQLDAFDGSPEIVEVAVAHGLAVGLDRNEPPPFGLVQVLEAVGLTQVRPERLDAATLIAQLLDAVPDEHRSAPAAAAAALAASKRWPKAYAFLQSWFEQDEAAHAAIGSVRDKRQQREAVLQQVLPLRRARWAELLAWTAKAAQDQVEDEAWIGFALVARELLGERPLDEIPVAGWIAGNTAAALRRR
ncbi:hypothetical protein OPKNFCMD_5711 [Methylobacterium crusticola]|uniref:TRIF N-terminal domain-containing protein n=1 Tax=Methylobacterium crusticola TaxID=1697972 RepID=A0ABQ4R5E9_9HYPH|nr:hypothetical protein [Methylobacterium crusticola]GJD52943.1 hypothetical protein OPKNFCMD_5711 [Methylobacterium crusticola]